LRKASAIAVQSGLKPTQHILILSLISFVISLLYARTLAYPFVNWDDPTYIHTNYLIRSLDWEHISKMFSQSYFRMYIPFTLLSYAVDYQWSHFSAFGYKLTNLIIHIINAGLVYGIITRLSGKWLVGLSVALVFGIHPVQIESVVWIAERKNVLSSLFFLCGIFVYARPSGASNQGRFFCSWILLLAGCFSKPNIVVAPLILIALDVCYRGKPLEIKSIGRYVPFFAGSFIFALVTFLIVRDSGKMIYHGGSIVTSFFAMQIVMMRYFELLIFPIRQSLLYFFPVYNSLFDPRVFCSFVGVLGASASAFLLFKRNRKRFFWAAWYVIMLIPMLNIIPFPSLMNDRYLYLPMIGFFTLLFMWIHASRGVKATVFTLTLAIVIFGILNVRRQVVWEHPEKLWLETQSTTQDMHFSPYINLGDLYMEQDQFDLAIAQYLKALSLSSKDEPYNAEAYNGLGIIASKRGEREDAEAYFMKAIALRGDKANYFSNLAMVYETAKDLDKAVLAYQKAIELDPKNLIPRSNLGVLLGEAGRPEEAIKTYYEILEIDQDDAATLYNLGATLYEMKRDAEASRHWKQFVRIHPDHAEAAYIKKLLSAMKAA